MTTVREGLSIFTCIAYSYARARAVSMSYVLSSFPASSSFTSTAAMTSRIQTNPPTWTSRTAFDALGVESGEESEEEVVEVSPSAPERYEQPGFKRRLVNLKLIQWIGNTVKTIQVSLEEGQGGSTSGATAAAQGGSARLEGA